MKTLISAGLVLWLWLGTCLAQKGQTDKGSGKDSSGVAAGQTKPVAQKDKSHTIHQITYDFATGAVSHVCAQPMGQMVSLKIININTFLYKVTVKGKQISYLTPIPTELQTLFRLPDPAQPAMKAEKGGAKIQTAAEEMQKIAKQPIVKSDSIANLLKEAVESLVVWCAEFSKAARRISEFKMRRARLLGLTRQPLLTSEKLVTLLPPPYDRTEMEEAVQDFLESYEKAERQYDIAIRLSEGKEEQKQIKAALHLFEEGYHELDEENLVKLITELELLDKTLRDPWYFEIISQPIQADGDFIAFDLVIEPIQTDPLLPSFSISPVAIEVPVKNSWKTDFSLGLNYAFGKGSRDYTYYLTPTTEGKGTLTQGSSTNATSPVITAMLHAYPRTGRNAAYGFLMGVGAGFKAENTFTASYFLGGSIILGKSQRVIVNGGASFLAVDRAKAGYTLGTEYKTDAIDLSSITEKRLQAGFFVGISYNITNRVESK